MASSYDVAQLFAQQNAMFTGQQQYAQSIGVPAPPMMGMVGPGGQGVGAYGMQGRGGPGFNFGQSPMMGYGPGNAVSAGVMSGMGAAYSGGSMALGAAGMFGMLGRAGALMDPFAMGGAAMRAGTAMGMGGIGAGMMGAGAFMAPLAGGMAISHGVQAFVNGGQQQSQMNTMLGSQYSFFNPLSRSGAGFSRDDSKAIGDMTRQLSHVPEMMSDFNELSQIMSRMKGSGMMQGVRNAADFQARFRETIGTIRETAKILGTTMQEAEQFFSASRGAGFYGRSSQLKNAISAQFTSGVTGATIGQVAGLQGAGADMAMSFGARRGLGAEAVTNIAQNIGLAQREGKFAEGAVEDVTGLQGPEAQLALAQKMFGGMMRFGQTAAGRLAMAGMMKYEGGKAVGVDADLVRKFNMGLIGVNELKKRAGGLSEKEKISFTNRQEDLVASLAGQMGPGGAYGMMKDVMGDKYGGDEEATNLVMRRMTGMSAGEIDIMQGMQGVSGEGEQGMFGRMRQRQAGQRELTDPSSVMKRIKTRLHASTLGKLEQAGADVQNAIAKSVDDFFDDMVGREISTLTEERAKAISQAFSGGHGSEAREMLKGLTGVGRRTSTGGFMGSESTVSRALAGLAGGQTAGQQSEYAAKVFGSGDAVTQAGVAQMLSGGKIAGGGADAAVSDIIASIPDFQSKTPAQQADLLTKGMAGKYAQAKIKQSNGETLTPQEQAVISSYNAASKNQVGNSVYAQMAAASGAGGVFKGLVGANLSGSKVATQAELKATDSELVRTLGETGAGLVKGGGAAVVSAMQKMVEDPELQNALQLGEMDKAQVILSAKYKINLTSKDIDALAQTVKGFKDAGLGADRTKQAITAYQRAAGGHASVEFREQLQKRGTDVIFNASNAGEAAAAQKRLGQAMSNLGQSGSPEAMEEYRKAFADYAKVLGGLKGNALETAIGAGGDTARQAYGVSELTSKFKGKSFKSTDEVAKALGISAEDAAGALGTFTGGKLTDDQLNKLANLGGTGRALLGAQSGDSGVRGKSKDEMMVDALQRISDNQIKLATAIGVTFKDAPKKGPNTNENANAGKNGQTHFGLFGPTSNAE